MDLENVMTYADIAARIKVKPDSVKVYRHRDENFPKPIELPFESRTPVFDRDEVERWIASRPGEGARGRPRTRP